ncbi:hypothetical protein [Kutzneria sp. CA-103260]|uniref:hypothetical protein n=1 Tax=Kutzneria sp. CA-103260 TaxID=2802641 RepID=UPI001BA82BF3|nr:hypothetical protein [Kutzneria sp. CA-103260]
MGKLTAHETSEEFCAAVLDELPRFVFRVGPVVQAAWLTLDLDAVLSQARHPLPRTTQTISAGPGAASSKELLENARGYLSDFLHNEDWFDDDGIQDWFNNLGRYVAALPLTHPHIRAAAQYLRPFLEDDDCIDGLLYPCGAAICYIERRRPGGDLDDYLSGFLKALAIDWRTWRDVTEHFGAQAHWHGAVRPAQPTGPFTSTNVGN